MYNELWIRDCGMWIRDFRLLESPGSPLSTRIVSSLNIPAKDAGEQGGLATPTWTKQGVHGACCDCH